MKRLLWPILLLCITMQCKTEAKSTEVAESTLKIEFLAVDTSFAPKGERPFIAGEKVRITLRVHGGTPPYELQLLTSSGDPRLASGATTVEAQRGADLETGMDIEFGAEVPSARYELSLRVSDQEGRGQIARSDPFNVLGADAEVRAPSLEAPHLQLVDVAGRARASFYQGEEIRIRARLEKAETIAVGVLAPDNRPFMPVRSYSQHSRDVDLGVRVPRLARPGVYRVDLATEAQETSALLNVVGTAYPEAHTPVIAALNLFGGPDKRAPRGAVLTRGERLKLEVVVGGVQGFARAYLRVRNSAGQVLVTEDLGSIVPTDPHPRARSILSSEWTPDTGLQAGRVVLEIEIDASGEVATLYREVELQ